MVSRLLLAWGLVAVCVVIHASGVTSAVRWLRRQEPGHALAMALVVHRLAGWIVFHVIEITVWALVYSGAAPCPAFSQRCTSAP